MSPTRMVLRNILTAPLLKVQRHFLQNQSSLPPFGGERQLPLFMSETGVLHVHFQIPHLSVNGLAKSPTSHIYMYSDPWHMSQSRKRRERHFSHMQSSASLLGMHLGRKLGHFTTHRHRNLSSPAMRLLMNVYFLETPKLWSTLSVTCLLQLLIHQSLPLFLNIFWIHQICIVKGESWILTLQPLTILYHHNFLLLIHHLAPL